MKVVSYKLKNKPGNYRVGFLLDEEVADMQEAWRNLMLSRGEKTSPNAIDQFLPAEPAAFFSIGESAMHKAKEAYEYIMDNKVKTVYLTKEEIQLSTPIPNPSKIICIGKNYADHAAEMGGDIPEFPVLFSKFSNAIIGPEDSIEKSKATEKLDYEVELAVVIGKQASKVGQDEALDYIAGYTIGNDISARDLQKRTPQWLQGKTLDRSTPIGPWIVTSDEIDDPSNLKISSYVNGEKRQSSTTRQLIFDIPFLIEFISNLITLNPGDIILTGTPDGVGFAMDPPQFLQAGDVVTVEVEKIGRMENKVREA
ncbi:2-hydroxyhepta-2,4-diene-1,7-dioate isomerase [Virgibacillus indicus]|uniref:2-hydroxyhepta-2,4-diene-1,7-dioate isomerase n=1 Tax=Virgibacillus indicus TaxID=2024554 RepID=A0A265N9P1_9BACI|nr:fumarylacetoacetate hydrolase family protein [Virgibacillus indicus]OZU88742.1 2-hydroxyhepta-2,4-diene-1,7-dioate isomerase [Virgibacillus indicus]